MNVHEVRTGIIEISYQSIISHNFEEKVSCEALNNIFSIINTLFPLRIVFAAEPGKPVRFLLHIYCCNFLKCYFRLPGPREKKLAKPKYSIPKMSI